MDSESQPPIPNPQSPIPLASSLSSSSLNASVLEGRSRHVGGWTAGSRLRSLRSFRAEHDTDRREQDVQVRQQRKIADVDEVVSETIFGIAAVGAEHV